MVGQERKELAKSLNLSETQVIRIAQSLLLKKTGHFSGSKARTFYCPISHFRVGTVPNLILRKDGLEDDG